MRWATKRTGAATQHQQELLGAAHPTMAHIGLPRVPRILLYVLLTFCSHGYLSAQTTPASNLTTTISSTTSSSTSTTTITNTPTVTYQDSLEDPEPAGDVYYNGPGLNLTFSTLTISPGLTPPPSTSDPLTTTPLTPKDVYSFLEPGRSYVEYRPQWVDLQRWGLRLSFRTHKTSTFLLHSSFVRDTTLGFSANIWVTLKKGVLHVTHMYQDQSYTLKLGKGLGHDHWHTVELTADLGSGDVRAAVDGEQAQNLTISSDLLTAMGRTLTGRTLTSITSLGGFSPEMLQAPSDFVGCVRGVRFLQGDQELTVPVHSRAEVTDGCVNACDSRNLCVHGGSCLNYYTYTTCDCFGTGYEGQYCQRPGGTVVTLQGSEWISYVISDVTDRTHSPINKVALEFKTRSTEGVLFYGYSQSQYNHLALSLHNSSLHVSVVFIDQDNYDELWVALGARLNDNRWHRVVVSHRGHEVQVELDAQTQKMTGRDDQRHLRMDPAVFIGGLENAHKALGLRSQQKFVGCLRAVYFNHDSVLEKLRFHQAVYHGGLIQYGCQDMEHTALQFPHKGAFVKAEHRSSDQLRVQLEFRTLKPDSILLYTETTSGPDKGFIQVLLEAGQVNLIVVPSAPHPQVRETASVGENLSDNQWHSLQLDYNRGTGRLEVDGEVSLISVSWGIHISRATYVGFGPDTQMKYGYVGCMRNVVLQDRDIDPVEVVHTQLGVGVTLGPCDLRDLCRLNGSNCQNGGQCVSVWTETYCECERTHYEGKYCQFSKLRRTCAEYFQAGETRSGVWLVDIDSSGPLPPTHVYCEMGVAWDDHADGVTLVHHNLAEGTMVRDSSLADHKKVVTYRELTVEMLDALVSESVSCHQWVHVNCSHSPLRLGDLTWLVSSSGREFSSLGSDTAGTCGCGQQHACVSPDLTCNCDADSQTPHWDGGYIRLKHHLPVTQLVFRQGSGQGQTNVTMGPLRCAGTRSQSLDTVVTFMTPQTYLELGGWRGGTLEFDFRSTRRDAFLLYQPLPGQDAQGPWNEAQLYVMVKGGVSLVVLLSEPSLYRTVHSSRPLSDGQWQHVSIQVESGQVRVQVNADRYLYDVSPDLPGLGYWASTLYVGGRPNNTGTNVAGMAGCIRGLIYNNKLHPLASLASPSAGVVSGCDPTCASGPCQHEADCEELWTSYVCHCSNPYAHSGTNCQININNDVVSFLETSDFLEFHQPGHLDFASEPVIFSFRTFQQRGLLLYLYDHLNNFLQIEIRGHNVLGVHYNNFKTIVNHDITVRDLADGTWKQIVVQMAADGIQIILNQKPLVIEQITPWKPLEEYEQTPFGDQAESVVPLRKLTADAALFHVYVGGALGAMSGLQGVAGCVRGLKVGTHVLQLAKAAGQTNNVHPGCASGCASSPCQHHGLCVEDVSFSGHYNCDCIGTGYSGALCDREVGVFFDGSTVMLQTLTPTQPSPSSGRHEGLHLNFATYTSNDLPRALVFVSTANRYGDYLLLYLTPGGVLIADVFINNVKVSLETDVSFINGWAHHVSLHREDAHVILQVDNMVVRSQLNGSMTFGPPAFILVGGAMDEPRLSHMANFTGDMSNVFVVSDYLSVTSVRPLDTFYGFTEGDGTSVMTVAGSLRPATQALVMHQTRGDSRGPVLLSGLPETTSPEMWTFAPWNVGAARTVNLAETPGMKSNSKSGTIALDEISDGEIVGILVCIALLLVLAMVIALFLVRMRRRKESQQTTPHDEEEGLIEMVATATEEEGPVEGEDEDGVGCRSRGVRRVKTPPARNGIHEEENEETPMLSNMEETGTSRPPGQNVDFMQMIESLPMIDEEEEEGERSTTQQQTEAKPGPREIDAAQCIHESGSTAQLEWDPQVEMKLVEPLMPLTYCEPVSTVVAENPELAKGEVWTESQVLAMLADDEPVNMMWDSEEDLFVDSTDQLVSSDTSATTPCTHSQSSLSEGVHPVSSSYNYTPPSPHSWAPNSTGKPQELILGLHNTDGNHPLMNCSPVSSNISAECLARPTAAHLSPTVAAVEYSLDQSDYDQDIPRVSSQIDLSQDIKAAAMPDWSPGHTSVDRLSLGSSGQGTEPGEDTRAAGEQLQSAPEHLRANPSLHRRGGHIEPNVIVQQCGPDSDDDTVSQDTSLGQDTCRNIRPTEVKTKRSNSTSESDSSVDNTSSDSSPLASPRDGANMNDTACSQTSDSKLSPSQIVLPKGTTPLQAPDGISPGLPQRRGIKLKRPRKKTK